MQVERILHGIEGIAFHYFTDADVVRHRLVRDIIKAYAATPGTERSWASGSSPSPTRARDRVARACVRTAAARCCRARARDRHVPAVPDGARRRAPLYEVGSVAPENVIAPFAFRDAEVRPASCAPSAPRRRARAPPVLGFDAWRGRLGASPRAQFRRCSTRRSGRRRGRGTRRRLLTEATRVGVRITPEELPTCATHRADRRCCRRRRPRARSPAAGRRRVHGTLAETRGDVAITRGDARDGDPGGQHRRPSRRCSPTRAACSPIRHRPSRTRCTSSC